MSRRDARRFRWLEDARWDARHALRAFARNPIVAATAALSLAIGIGANTAVFTVVNALLFRAPAGVVDPDRVVDVGIGRPDTQNLNPGSYPTYRDLSARTTTLDGLFARQMFPHAMSLAASDSASESIFAYRVTANYFDVLGVRPAVGRLFTSADRDEAGLAVLSHRFWTRRFHGDPAVVGRTVRLNGRPFDVVGVAPEGFQGTAATTCDLWVPLGIVPSDAAFSERAGGWLLMGGRVKPGVELSVAAAEVDAIGQALQREHPAEAAAARLRLLPASMAGGSREVLAVVAVLLAGIVSMVLLVACANVSGVLLARGVARRHEIAVRVAIGAGRGRLVRQLLMEAIVLFAIGGTLGFGLALAMTTVVVTNLPALPFPIQVSLTPDLRVIVFTAGLSFIAALASGIVPALQATSAPALREDAQGGARGSRLRQLFVVWQVAGSVVLVVAAGLFARAIARAGSINPGFDPRGVELATLDLTMGGYGDTIRPAVWRQLRDRVRSIPGVDVATLGRVMPGGFEGIGLGGVAARSGVAGAEQLGPSWNIVEPGYFSTLHLPLVAGRDFTDADRSGTQLVAIVGEGMARRLWPAQSAVGQPLFHTMYGPKGATRTRALLVVGVARDIRSSSLVDGLYESFVYLPLQQVDEPPMTTTMVVAARANAGLRIREAIRTTVEEFDKRLTIVSAQTLEDSVALGLVPQHVVASVAGSLGLVGLLLAAIGIYGVTAFAVSRRTRELGIRIALGADTNDILLMVMRQGVVLTIVGCAIGLALGAGVATVLAGFLFGLPPLDPASFGGAVALFAVTGLVASYGPARRATKIDPMAALRQE